MPDVATLRLTWEPRMLSILRIVVGLLYMEHGLAKMLDFPHQPNHVPYAPFTLNPGLQGLLELAGGLLLALGLFTRTVAFVLRGQYGGRLFHGARAKRVLPAAQRLGIGNRLLFRLPLFLGRRGRRMEPRSIAGARIGTRRIAEPGLSKSRRTQASKASVCRSPATPTTSYCFTTG
jgi:putative oxidoreductase